MTNLKHWQVSKDDEQIIWLGLDRKNETANTINNEVLDELNQCLQDISSESAKGMVIYSLKDNGFIAGADVKEFSTFDTPKQAVDFLRKGQTVFSRIEQLKIPTVAIIDGFCMGGGLELALACDYRIATNADNTRIGLPEVLLGIHPGWGGTVRLPKLIGGFNALTQVILTGAGLRPTKAKKLGIIDDVVPVRQLKRAAVYFIKKKVPKHQPGFIQSLTNHPIIRPVISKLIRGKLIKKVSPEHYPAPYAALSLWEKEARNDERAYLKEADSIEQLITQNHTASNLIRLFKLRERMKGFAKESSFAAKHVHVIGAGVMGGDIAAWCALRGLRVTLQDQSFERVAPAIARAFNLYKKKLKKKRLIQAAMDRLMVDIKGEGIQHADVVIEAVFENLQVKQELFKVLEQKAKPDAILATNTSSIPLDEISESMCHPERLVGIHFFNPVAKMELVEVVSSPKTSQKVSENSCAFVGQIGRLPLPVASLPGFLVNRVLMPYLMECVQLLDEGYKAEVIDHAAKSFGMVMGPVELADTVGMDVCLAVAENLTSHFGGKIPGKLKELVKAGHLGRKSGQGFYQWKKGRPIKEKLTSSSFDQDIANRLILRMVNESAACLRENVVEDSDLLDAAMVFGTGFAPFRGGPMHYANHFNKEQLNKLFKQLESQYGERFKADVSL